MKSAKQQKHEKRLSGRLIYPRAGNSQAKEQKESYGNWFLVQQSKISNNSIKQQVQANGTKTKLAELKGGCFLGPSGDKSVLWKRQGRGERKGVKVQGSGPKGETTREGLTMMKGKKMARLAPHFNPS